MSLTSSQLRAYGIDPNTGRRIVAPVARAKRGSVKAKRVSNLNARRERLLSLLGLPALPDGMDVKPSSGELNGWEKEYARQLAMDPIVEGWDYELVRFRIAPGCFYTPDFIVCRPDEPIEFIETKGRMREAARLRLLVAADRYRQCRFVLLRKVNGKWDRKVIEP